MQIENELDYETCLIRADSSLTDVKDSMERDDINYALIALSTANRYLSAIKPGDLGTHSKAAYEKCIAKSKKLLDALRTDYRDEALKFLAEDKELKAEFGKSFTIKK